MAGLTSRGSNRKNKHIKKANLKTKRYKRDIDQIVLTDLQPANSEALLHQPVDEYKPGLGQNYCLHCSRYFISDYAMEHHYKTKEHKKRIKTCKEIPYSHEEANRGGGLQPAVAKFTVPIYQGKTKMADLENS